MIKTLKRITALMMSVLLIASLIPITAAAAGRIDPNRDVNLTISYVDGKKAIQNAMFDLYKVANVDERGSMTLTADFEKYRGQVSGLNNLENMDQESWELLAYTLRSYAQRDNLSTAAKGKTDAGGAISLTVKPGLYLAVGHRITDSDFNTYTAKPFMLYLPGQDMKNNAWIYDVTAVPKFEKETNPHDDDDDYITRKVLKIWDDAGFETIRPKSVTVQLLCDGKIYDEKELNKENNWRWAWDNLKRDHEWTLVEKEVSGYSVIISMTGITFTVTNKVANPVISEDPPVYKRITGDTPSSASTFIFVLTAASPSNPMPAGSQGSYKEISITGAGSSEFGKISFDKPGSYTYTVREKNSGVNGYTYDTNQYTIIFEVTQGSGKLNIKTSISDSTGKACSTIVFTNNYKTPGNKVPQTGVLWWPVPVLFSLGMALVFIGLANKRRTER